MLCVRISCVSSVQLFLLGLGLIIDRNTLRISGTPKGDFRPVGRSMCMGPSPGPKNFRRQSPSSLLQTGSDLSNLGLS